MGWNSAYTIMESTVIGAYNLGKLDRDLLTVLLEPYRGTDIDSGGSRNLLTEDGKCVEQVVIEAFGISPPRKPGRNASDEKWEAYHEELYERFYKITSQVFGWK